jgi:hypothetical protein
MRRRGFRSRERGLEIRALGEAKVQGRAYHAALGVCWNAEGFNHRGHTVRKYRNLKLAQLMVQYRVNLKGFSRRSDNTPLRYKLYSGARDSWWMRSNYNARLTSIVLCRMFGADE